MDEFKLPLRYRIAILLPIVVIILYPLWCYLNPVTTVLLVRHAERTGSVDNLNAQGLARAEKLVHVTAKAGISAIYHSDANRTQQTVAEVANTLGMTAIEINASDVEELVDHIKTNFQGETVLVASHSNRVPDIIEELGGGAYPDIDHAEYDNLFVVTYGGCWCHGTKVLNLQYGAESP